MLQLNGVNNNKYMLFTSIGRSVLGKTVPKDLDTARGQNFENWLAIKSFNRPRMKLFCFVVVVV